MVRSTGRHHAVQTGMINKTHLHGPPNPQKSPGAVWGKARYRLGQPLTQTTRCVFKQPLQTNRATIISKCKKETNETTLNQTKPNQTNKQLNKNQTHLPCSSNPQKPFQHRSRAPILQPKSSASPEPPPTEAAGAGIACTCRRRTDLHLDGFRIGPEKWGEEGHQLVPLFWNFWNDCGPSAGSPGWYGASSL